MNKNIWRLLEKAVLETLEDRRMMSVAPAASIALNNGVLSLTADPKAYTRMTVDLNSSGNISAYVGTPTGRSIENFSPKQVKSISITGADGPDYIFINPHILVPASISTGNGNDTVRAGGGNDTIVCGTGNDYVHVVAGNNVIYGGTGSDFLVGGKSDTDTIYAGAGYNRIDGGGGYGTIVNSKKTDKVYDLGHVKLTTGVVTNPITVSTGGNTNTNTGGNTNTNTGGNTNTNGGGGTTTTNTGGNTNAPKPTPDLQLLGGVRQTGIAVNVNALNSTLGSGTALTGAYSWNFGDAQGDNNAISGWTAAHVYDKPGTYTITLTLTNDQGGTATATQQVVIAASSRSQIYVDSVNGSDSNTGSQNSPVKTAQQAFSMLGDNTEILFKAGETFDVTSPQVIQNNNVLVGRYGSGVNPVLNRLKGNFNSTITVSSVSNSVTIQDITIDSPYGVGANDAAPKIGVSGIYLGGSNLAVRGCTFLNVDDAINENGSPIGVLIADNDAPLATGVRGYFIWCQGTEQTIINNTAANSTREHVLRMVDFNNVTVENNTFTNLDRSAVDSGDYSKGCVEMHVGQYGYVIGNTVIDGDIRTGPLGLWGEASTDSTDDCVIEDNQLTDTFVSIDAGSHHIQASNNVVNADNGVGFIVGGQDTSGHLSADITINNNTGINNGSTGSFIRLQGYVNGVTMDNNLFIAPNLNISGQNTPVYVASGAMNSFTKINGNIWADPSASSVINSAGDGNTFDTPAQWNAQSAVGTDGFANATLNDTYQVSLGTLLAGSSLKRAA